jgi:serine/threonine protein kinase/WD40 repeat protein
MRYAVAVPDLKEEAIFDTARRIEVQQDRHLYVHQACGNDLALQARVEALLRVYDADRSFLQPPEGLLAGTRLVGEGPGARIGPYQLLERLGEGGFGVVFLAQQQYPVCRQVALKILKPGMDTRQVVARFEAERQALALMNHPNIAHVLGGGETASGRPYFVMEWVPGAPLTDFCDQNHFTVRQRLELFASVCQAVQHAHQKGVIHRDLKPSNVLVTVHDGAPMVKVIDFGIAKALGQKLTDKTLVTNATQFVGTPLYMSPEQAEMNGLDVDTRSDVYALGVLLYELLTGTTPFAKERLQTVAFDELRRILREEEPARPSARITTPTTLDVRAPGNRRCAQKRLGRGFRGELDWIVMKCLEKDRTRRYQTASGLARDIHCYLNEEPVQACPPSVIYRMRKFLWRNKGPVLAASLVLLALVGGIIGTTWGMIRATEAQAVAVNEAKQKEAALQASQQSERDARNQLFLALLNQARAGRFSRQPGQRLHSLAALAKAARLRPDERLRDEAIAALALPDIRRVPGWRSALPSTATLAYGGQYRLYARVDTHGILTIRRIPDDQEVRRIASGPIQGAYLFFSPDERFLLGLGDGFTLRVWRVADGEPALRDELRGCRSHAFSPDGRQLAVCWQEWVLCFDLATGQEVKRWRLPASAQTLAFHPDNGKLAVGYFCARATSVYDAASGVLLAELPVGPMSAQIVAWHPDGERLAVAGCDPRIQIWNVAARHQVASLEGHAQRVTTVTFHPGGELMASHGWDGQLLLWHPSTGRQLMRLTSINAPHFSTDGRWLGVTWDGDRADLLEVTPTREYRTLVSSAGAGRGSYGYYGDISPDGRLLVVGMNEGARLWDLRTSRELAALPAGTTFGFFDSRGGDVGPAPSKRRRWKLLTSGSAGLLRWPIACDVPGGEPLRLGPPQQLSRLGRAWFTRRADGRTLAAATAEDGPNQILDLETGAVQRHLGRHPCGEVQALSRNGRWAASSGWHSECVRLWDTSTGQLVREWNLGKRATVFFTPDSRSLIISQGDEFSFWDVATLQLIHRLPRDVALYPGHVAFSPDGRLMALEMAPAVLHLKEVATGRTVAKLEDPNGDRATWQGFTPDGTRLVVAAKYASAIHVWDLRAIRTRLKHMNLDWDWPEFPPAPAR